MVILFTRLKRLVDGLHQLVYGLQVLEHVREEPLAVCPLQVGVLLTEPFVDLFEVMKEGDLLNALGNDLCVSLFGLNLA